MTVCLQGGGEFSPGCRTMDTALLQQVDGPIVVTALAGTPGRDYARASANGVSHFRALGASDVVAAPDVRERPAEALAVLATARLLVLPGGSPSRLLTALTESPVGQLLRELLESGGSVMGASAGAMVLCGWTVLPDRRGAGGMAVVPGLGVVPDTLVVPHWQGGSSRGDWLSAITAKVPGQVEVLGLPEESGVVIDGSRRTAVGQHATRRIAAHLDVPVGQSWEAP